MSPPSPTVIDGPRWTFLTVFDVLLYGRPSFLGQLDEFYVSHESRRCVYFAVLFFSLAFSLFVTCSFCVCMQTNVNCVNFPLFYNLRINFRDIRCFCDVCFVYWGISFFMKKREIATEFVFLNWFKFVLSSFYFYLESFSLKQWKLKHLLHNKCKWNDGKWNFDSIISFKRWKVECLNSGSFIYFETDGKWNFHRL